MGERPVFIAVSDGCVAASSILLPSARSAAGRANNQPTFVRITTIIGRGKGRRRGGGSQAEKRDVVHARGRRGLRAPIASARGRGLAAFVCRRRPQSSDPSRVIQMTL